MDMNASSYLLFLKLLGFLKNMEVATSKHLHLLNYIITRKDCDYTSNFRVSDFISDHRALHLSLRCMRPHPARKRIQVRALRRIRGDVLDADLAGFIVDEECDDVNVVVTQYDDFLSELLDKHAPLKEIDVVKFYQNIPVHVVPTITFLDASVINTFFLDKISMIRADFPLLEPTLKPYTFDSIDSILPHCTASFDHFVPLTSVELLKII